MSWAVSIQELNDEDLANLAGTGNPPCAWGGCLQAARWEVGYEDLVGENTIKAELAGEKAREVSKSSPNSVLWSSQFFRHYCDHHARALCIDGNLDLPTKLVVLPGSRAQR